MHRLLRIGLAALLATASITALGDPASQGIDANQLRTLVEHDALDQVRRAPLAANARRVEVEADALDSRLRFAGCAEPIQVRIDLGRQAGRYSAHVSCPAPSPWAIYVPLEVRVFRDIVVATRGLARGEVVGPGDVALQERDALDPGSTGLTRLEDAIGLVVRQTVAAQAPVRGVALELPVLVHRGEHVSLVSRSGAISVSASAEALADGSRGDRIRARNVRSQRVIEATVTGAGQLEVGRPDVFVAQLKK